MRSEATTISKVQRNTTIFPRMNIAGKLLQNLSFWQTVTINWLISDKIGCFWWRWRWQRFATSPLTLWSSTPARLLFWFWLHLASQSKPDISYSEEQEAYLGVHHSHNRDDDGDGGKNNVKGADDDCARSKTCAAETFLPPVVRFHHCLLHFKIGFSTIFKQLGVYFTQKRNSWKERMKETAFLRGVWESACACAGRESQSASISSKTHLRQVWTAFTSFASVWFHWKWWVNQHIAMVNQGESRGIAIKENCQI